MEVIKTTEKMEFDVIYADGTRKRLALRPEAFDFAKTFFAPMLSALTTGTGIRPLLTNVPNIVAITRADRDILHQSDNARRQAIYRLGQMDMRESIADMLVDLADGTQGSVCSTLIDAAQRVRELKLCEKAEDEHG